ncbi:MAG: AI-2E family transporter [Planctomycetes bacterium]|nr:AI-2E family transporter [Planctomycetota bacterium]
MATPEAQPAQTGVLRRVLMYGMLVLVAGLTWTIVHPFAAGLLWALILSVVLWPLHILIRGMLPRPMWLAPTITTTVMTGIIVVPIVLVIIFGLNEAGQLIRQLQDLLEGRSGNLEGLLRDLPYVGDDLAAGLLQLRAEGTILPAIVKANQNELVGFVGRVIGGLSRNLFELTICVVTSWFFFRHGEDLSEQAKRAIARTGGEYATAFIPAIRNTLRAVVYGLVVTAVAQGVLMAVGLWVAGVPYPLLLGLLTFLLSFAPFGVVFVWLGSGLALLSEQRTLAGVLLILYGFLIVSSIDNVLRPIFIGRAAKLPFLLVFIAILGGISSFGLVGLFLGPVVVAVALTLWRTWVQVREAQQVQAAP